MSDPIRDALEAETTRVQDLRDRCDAHHQVGQQLRAELEAATAKLQDLIVAFDEAGSDRSL